MSVVSVGEWKSYFYTVVEAMYLLGLPSGLDFIKILGLMQWDTIMILNEHHSGGHFIFIFIFHIIYWVI